MIGDRDCMLAAIARCRHLKVVTRNQRDFVRAGPNLNPGRSVSVTAGGTPALPAPRTPAFLVEWAPSGSA
jgi:hypothetical protein